MGKMNLAAIRPLIGDEAKARHDECLNLLLNVNWPLYFAGPSGSGKTQIGMSVSTSYAEKVGVDAYYIQLSPDQTKTSVIGGHRLKGGELKSVVGTFGMAMKEGGIIFVDEVRHATQSLMLMFNSALDRMSVTSVGDRNVIAEPTFRVIFAANKGFYAANSLLPQSFANRLSAYDFDYPSFIDEVKIATAIAEDEFKGNMDVPTSVVDYLVRFARESRTELFPLSARNIASAMVRLSIVKKKSLKNNTIDSYFTQGSNAESTRRAIAKRILDREITDVSQLNTKPVKEFLQYVSGVGIDKFRECVLGSFMYHLDVDGSELNRDTMRTQMASAVI